MRCQIFCCKHGSRKSCGNPETRSSSFRSEPKPKRSSQLVHRAIRIRRRVVGAMEGEGAVRPDTSAVALVAVGVLVA